MQAQCVRVSVIMKKTKIEYKLFIKRWNVLRLLRIYIYICLLQNIP